MLQLITDYNFTLKKFVYLSLAMMEMHLQLWMSSFGPDMGTVHTTFSKLNPLWAQETNQNHATSRLAKR